MAGIYSKSTVNLIIPVVKLLCLCIQVRLPQVDVEHLHCCSWMVFDCQTLWFHYPALQKRAHKVTVNLLNLHMAFHASCLSHNLRTL